MSMGLTVGPRSREDGVSDSVEWASWLVKDCIYHVVCAVAAGLHVVLEPLAEYSLPFVIIAYPKMSEKNVDIAPTPPNCSA